MRIPRTLLAATTISAAVLTLAACGDSGSSAASSSAGPTFSSVPTAAWMRPMRSWPTAGREPPSTC